MENQWVGLKTCCEGCRQEFIKLLDERIEDTLAIARSEPADCEEEREENPDHAKTHCFEFMELRQILKGKFPALGRYSRADTVTTG